MKKVNEATFGEIALREKCLNTEFFLVCIFLYLTEYGDLLTKSSNTLKQFVGKSQRIQENTDQKKLRILTLFTR